MRIPPAKITPGEKRGFFKAELAPDKQLEGILQQIWKFYFVIAFSFARSFPHI
jgi:hypothetical protein